MADFQIVVRTKKTLSVHLNLALFTPLFVPVSKEISITITMISDLSGSFRLNPKIYIVYVIYPSSTQVYIEMLRGVVGNFGCV